MVEFLISVNEKKRTAVSNQEFQIIQKAIAAQKTDDDPASTPYFSTGYIEIKSPKNNNERYFVKISDVNKETMKLTPDKTKINLLKSVSVYSFQNILSSLNFGDIETNSPQDLLYKKLESLNLSICHLNCQTNPTKDLAPFAMNVGKIVSFEVVGNDKISNMDDFNKYVLAQQWCVLKNFSNACSAPEFEGELDKLAKNIIIKELITRHKGSAQLCSFLQKK